jgi:outer membrane protein assembly factor BamB
MACKRRLLVDMTTLVLAVFIQVAAPAADEKIGDWSQWRGPNRDGVSAETDWRADWDKNGPKRLWKREVGTGLSSVTTRGDRVFTMGNAKGKDTVYCLDAETGKDVWRHSYDSPLLRKNFPGGPTASPVLDGERVYTISRSGVALCLDIADGKEVWRQDLRRVAGSKPPIWGFAGSAVVIGEKVLFNVGRAGVALKKDSGELAWKTRDGPSAYASPVPFIQGGDDAGQGGDDAVAVFGNKALHGVRVADGKILWRVDWPTSFGENTADPLVLGDRLYLSSAHGRGSVLFQLTDGEPRVLWKNKGFGNHTDAPVPWKGNLFGFEGRVNRRGGSLKCVELETGKIRWSAKDVKGSLNIAGGRLLIMTLDGKLIVAEASAEAYKPLASAQLLGRYSWTPPVLSHGRLFCRNGNGTLLCLDLREK